MKGIWTGDKGKRRWFCHDCFRHFGTKRAAQTHQAEMLRGGRFHELTRGAVQWE